MTKYIRSTKKLTTLIKEIFAACEISIDTRAIVLLLAATMPSTKFNIWIDNITALRPLSDKYKQVNALKAVLGSVCSQYIFLTVLQKIDHDLNSDELQQFISDGGVIDQQEFLQPALIAAELKSVHSIELPIQHEGFAVAKKLASDLLHSKLSNNKMPHLSAILDTYTHCRQHSSPEVAYYAIVHAIAEILIKSGYAVHEALSHGNKLATHGLKDLIHMTNSDKLFTRLYDTSVNRLTSSSLR